MWFSKLIIKVMLKSKWLNMVLDVNFVTLVILNFILSSFLYLLKSWGHHKNYLHNVLLLYFKNLTITLFNITYLQAIVIVFLNMYIFAIVFCNINLLALWFNMFWKCLWLSFKKNSKSIHLILNHFHLDLCRDQKWSTILCLHLVGFY